jgi:AcrR family transcriptional regulator
MDIRLKILKVAWQGFAKHGYFGVSLNNIISKTSLTKGGVFHYFGSKQELFQEVFVGQVSMCLKEPDSMLLRGLVELSIDCRRLDLQTELEMYSDMLANIIQTNSEIMDEVVSNLLNISYTKSKDFKKIKNIAKNKEVTVRVVGKKRIYKSKDDKIIGGELEFIAD